jgi:serine protease Do
VTTLLVALALGFSPSLAPAASAPTLDERAVYERAAPAVVVVRAVADGRSGVGTGFLVDPGAQRAGRAPAGTEALVLTAAHVVRGAERLLVEFPEDRALPAELVGYDAWRDVALLRIYPERPLPALPLASTAGLRPGEPVLVIGTPRGRPGVLSRGAVVEVGATLPGLVPGIMLRLSAPAAPGSSGSPVLTLRGEVVGMVVAMSRGSESLAVAGSVLLALLGDLQQGARVERAWLGVAGRTLTAAEARARGVRSGVLVVAVVSGSPAARAGVREGDVIVRLDDEPVAEWEDVLWAVGRRTPGEAVRLVVVRGGATRTLEVVLGVRP